MPQDPGADGLDNPASAERPLRWEVSEPGMPQRGRSDDPFEILMPPRSFGTSTRTHTTRNSDLATHLARTEKNWMAIVALVCALFVAAPLAILFGHLALNAASRGEAQNEGVALAALVIGYLSLVIGVLWFLFS
jgi:Domain of unknown function (DUF4190)